VGVEGEFVLRDLFLDGSTLWESPSVERVPWVGRLQGRIQVGSGRFGLEAGATRSTLQFQGQEGSHTHGAIGFIIRS
jgi:hypothetical protein